MTKMITRVILLYPACPTCKYYRYEQLSSNIYSLLCSALLAGLRNGDIVDYMIYNMEVLSNDEKRH